MSQRNDFVNDQDAEAKDGAPVVEDEVTIQTEAAPTENADAPDEQSSEPFQLQPYTGRKLAPLLDVVFKVNGIDLPSYDCPRCGGHPVLVIPDPGIVPGILITNYSKITYTISEFAIGSRNVRLSSTDRLISPGDQVVFRQEELEVYADPRVPEFGSMFLRVTVNRPDELRVYEQPIRAAIADYVNVFGDSSRQSVHFDRVLKALRSLSIGNKVPVIAHEFATQEFWELCGRQRERVNSELRAQARRNGMSDDLFQIIFGAGSPARRGLNASGLIGRTPAGRRTSLFDRLGSEFFGNPRDFTGRPSRGYPFGGSFDSDFELDPFDFLEDLGGWDFEL